MTSISLRCHFGFTSMSTLSRHACARGDVWAHIGFSQLSAREGKDPTQESKAATRTCQKSNQGGPGQGHDPNPKQTLAIQNRSASSNGPRISCPEFMGFCKGMNPGQEVPKRAPPYTYYGGAQPGSLCQKGGKTKSKSGKEQPRRRRQGEREGRKQRGLTQLNPNQPKPAGSQHKKQKRKQN